MTTKDTPNIFSDAEIIHTYTRAEALEDGQVNYFYSEYLSNDSEGSLIQLCQHCAMTYRNIIQWAGEGDPESECEICDACNDPQ